MSARGGVRAEGLVVAVGKKKLGRGVAKWGVLTELFQQFLCLAYRLRKVTWSDPIAKKSARRLLKL